MVSLEKKHASDRLVFVGTVELLKALAAPGFKLLTKVEEIRLRAGYFLRKLVSDDVRIL